jgi:hypothetical protein
MKKIGVHLMDNKYLCNINCDSKGFINKLILLTFILAMIFFLYVIGSGIYNTIRWGFFASTLPLIAIVLILFIIMCIPMIYFIMKFINFRFHIIDGNIKYIDNWKKEYNYNIKDIKEVKYYHAPESFDSITIYFRDNKKVRIISTDTNFKDIKDYFSSMGLI